MLSARNGTMKDFDVDKLSPLPSTQSTLVPPPPDNLAGGQPRRSVFARHFVVPAFSSRAKSPTPSNASGVSTSRGVDESKGPFGLTTISHPANVNDVIAHIILVHGLGGGSEHTWTKDDIFWPRDLLPLQEPFQNACIHTFGYDSDFKKSSTLNINDFSKSLLNSIPNNPSIRDSDVRAPPDHRTFAKLPFLDKLGARDGGVPENMFSLLHQLTYLSVIPAMLLSQWKCHWQGTV